MRLVKILFLITFALTLFFYTINKNSLQKTSIQINNQTIQLQIAETNQQRQKGLMNIQHLPKNEGMLFKFNQEAPRNFWMKNTLIPLDIIFLNKNKQIINIHHNTPPCQTIDPQQQNCPTYPSTSPAQYTIELSAGQASNLNLKPNQKINF